MIVLLLPSVRQQYILYVIMEKNPGYISVDKSASCQFISDPPDN